jgi:hypothetical protein
MPSIKNKAGHVYLFRLGDFVKIGGSGNVLKRSKAFSTLPYPFSLLHAIESSDVNRVEKHLHACFQAERVNGEWFRLSDEQIDKLLSVTTANSVEELQRQIPSLEGSSGYGEIRFTFHLEPELLQSLDAYIAALPHDPGRSQVVRGAIRDFLKEKGFFPPSRKQ